jgi:RNA processing factor Prp31
MNAFIETIDKSAVEIEKLQKLFKKSSSRQVSSKDEKDVLKAVAITWFQTHRPIVLNSVSENLVKHIDNSFQELLSSADKSPLRQKCFSTFKQVKSDLIKLRTENIVAIVAPVKKTVDTVPNFSNLAADVDMQKILASRWDECNKCVENNAPLAAVVMMGGLLETLLLSKINSLTSPTPVYTAKLAPKNPQNKTLPLKEWGLRNYIEVAHELTWITQTEKDLGAVLMDYRNYIHPFKQKTYGVFLQPSDARILWELCKSISKQLL